MTFEELILITLIKVPPYETDKHETIYQRVNRLRPVASVISEVSRTKEEAAALIALGTHESHWASYVLEGRCSEGPKGRRCDDGRARGSWQLWSWCKEAYKYPAGSLESLKGEAVCAVNRLRWAYKECRGVNPDGDMAGMMARYGPGCLWSKGKDRAVTMSKILRKEEWKNFDL